jgi:hypothetical protein
MAEWHLRLAGNMAELDRLVSELNEPALAVRRDVRGFYMTSTVFGTDDKVNPTEASVGALIAKLNGVVHVLFGSDAAITVASLEFARDDGTRIAVGFMEPIVAGSEIVVGRGVALRDGVPVPPSRSRAARLIEATENNDDAEHVLRILGGDLDWVSMYKVVEIVKKHCGGEAGIANAGWATKKEVNLFTHTANSVGSLGDRARHGVETTQPPIAPMLKHDAVALIRRLAQRWLESLI